MSSVKEWCIKICNCKGVAFIFKSIKEERLFLQTSQGGLTRNWKRQYTIQMTCKGGPSDWFTWIWWKACKIGFLTPQLTAVSFDFLASSSTYSLGKPTVRVVSITYTERWFLVQKVQRPYIVYCDFSYSTNFYSSVKSFKQ